MIIKDRGEVPILEEWGCLEWFFLRGIVRHFWSVFGVVVESRSRLMISVSIWAISPFFFVFLQILTQGVPKKVAHFEPPPPQRIREHFCKTPAQNSPTFLRHFPEMSREKRCTLILWRGGGKVQSFWAPPAAVFFAFSMNHGNDLRFVAFCEMCPK